MKIIDVFTFVKNDINVLTKIEKIKILKNFLSEIFDLWRFVIVKTIELKIKKIIEK